MKNRAPVRMHHGHPAEHKVILPAAYIAVLAYRASDRDRIVSQLPEILHDCQGEVLSQEIAEHEWENRFKLMIVKRLGPSLVPAEVVVPLENLGAVHGGDRAEDQPARRQGGRHRPERTRRETRGRHPRLHPQRPAQVLLQLRLRPGPVDHQDRRKARRPALLDRHVFRPQGGGDPGPGPGAAAEGLQERGRPEAASSTRGRSSAANLVSRALGVAKVFEPLIRPFGNTVVTQVGERLDEPVQAGHPRRCRLVRLRLFPVRLLRRRVRPVLRPRLGEPVAARQMVLAARVPWKAGRSGTRRWSTPSWSARPASSATSAARRRCPSSRAG